MLTLEKVKIYESFRGDIDGFARARGRENSSGITDEDWLVIDQLCQSLHLVASGKASAAFAAEIDQSLHAMTADERTREALRKLATG